MTPTRYATPFPPLHAASLLSHRSRIAKFAKVMQEEVTDDSYVVDLGTGSGVLAMIAARLGARRVTAVDIDPETLAYAKSAAALNGLDKEIEFVNTHFSEFVPDERADLVVCEMLCSMLLVEQQVPAARHAWNAILKKGGHLLPTGATVYVIPVQSPDVFSRFAVETLRFPPVPQTIDRSESTDLANLKELVHFDFSSSHFPDTVEATLKFRILRSGICHGLLGMFEASLSKEVKLIMSDGWRELLLPFKEPLEVTQGEDLTVSIGYNAGQYDSLRLCPGTVTLR